MTASDVIEVLDALAHAGVGACVDGGWGVDALVGRTTRNHYDLDLALDRNDLERARKALEAIGYLQERSVLLGLPIRLAMTDEHGRQLDLHVLEVDEAGNGWQKLSETGRAWTCYWAEHLSWV